MKYSGVCYNERGGILSADVARACASRVGPSALIRAQFISVICFFAPLAVKIFFF